MLRVVGSSPLAQGLPSHQGHRRRHPRIIPARAGFTTCRRPGSRSRPDHPRSRGVYPRRPWPAATPAGSSPLARGLRDLRVPRRGGCRIIPARAGFTPRPRRARHARADHRRSRGVYAPRRYRGLDAGGSSPLARGLRVGSISPRSGLRIIPARAGFTWPTGTAAWWRPDHPRSRGVYVA